MATQQSRYTEKVIKASGTLGCFVLLFAACMLVACGSDGSSPTIMPPENLNHATLPPEAKPMPTPTPPEPRASTPQPSTSGLPQATHGLPTLAISGTDSVLPTASITTPGTATNPLVTGAPHAVSPTIAYFEVVELHETDEGRRVTFNWSAEGVSARLFSGTRRRLQEWWVVPLSGTLTVDLQGTVYRNPAFSLVVSDSDDWFSESALKVQAAVQIEWGCEHDYFFSPAPERCPLGSATASWAAEQLFEGGRMMWLEVEDAVYIFYDPGASGLAVVERYDDNWTPGELEDNPTITAPPGFVLPIRGFGRVWRDDQVRARLGWALAPELGYEANVQHEHHEGSSSGAPTYFSTGDGRVIWRFHSTWGYAIP